MALLAFRRQLTVLMCYAFMGPTFLLHGLSSCRAAIFFSAPDLSVGISPPIADLTTSVNVFMNVDSGGAVAARGFSLRASILPLANASGSVVFGPPPIANDIPNLPPSTVNGFFDFDLDFGGKSYGFLDADPRIMDAIAVYVPPVGGPPPVLDGNGNLSLPSGRGLVSLPLTISAGSQGLFQLSFLTDSEATGVSYFTGLPAPNNVALHQTAAHLSAIISVGIGGNSADFNHDSRVSGADLLVWKTSFGVNGGADANGDGKSDGTDFLAWQRQLSSALTADFDHDTDVDDNDLTVWKSAFGLSAGADANGDGVTDGADLLVWQRQLGLTGAAMAATETATPEPSSAVLGMICLLGAVLFTLRSTRFCRAFQDD